VDKPDVFNAVEARVGASVILSCAMSHPAKKIRFYKKSADGNLLPLVIDGSKFQLLNLQELVIHKVKNEDDGFYGCRRENAPLKDKEIKLFINQCK